MRRTRSWATTGARSADGAAPFGAIAQGRLWMLAALAACGTALAQGPPLPLTAELAVPETTAGAQEAPAVGMDDSGGFVVVWESDVAGGGRDVFARRFTAQGSAAAGEFVVPQNTTGDQVAPAIEVNGGGDWLVLWVSTEAGQGVRGRATADAGATLLDEFAFSQATSGGATALSASRGEEGSAVGGWNLPAATVRRFDGTGAPATGDVAPGATLQSPLDPAVAALADGDFAVAIQVADNDGRGIFGERFDAAGAPLGLPERLTESEDNDQHSPDLAATADGRTVAVWVDAALGIRARCLASTGVATSPELAVGGASERPKVAVAPDGAFVVTFRTPTDDIAAREYDRACRPVGPSFTVNTVTSGIQSLPDVASSNDRYVVVWRGSGAGGDGDGSGVARRLFRRRSLFAGAFESGDASAWSAIAP